MATNWKGAFIALYLDDGDGGGCSDDIVDLSREEYLALQAAGKSNGKGAVMFAVESTLEKIKASSHVVHADSNRRPS
jgi:hypothetical protein